MDERARRARTLLLVLLLLGQLLRAARAVRHVPPHAPPARIVVDPARDPPWRLRLVPGIGPVRAARIVAARGSPGVTSDTLLERALGARLAARIAATPLVELRAHR